MAIKALVRLTGGINYWTPIVDGLVFPGNRSGVMMFKCSTMPVPFWSRASQEKKAIIRLPDRLDSIAGAQLLVKVWDGGEGTVKEPFKINGGPIFHSIRKTYPRCGFYQSRYYAGASEIG